MASVIHSYGKSINIYSDKHIDFEKLKVENEPACYETTVTLHSYEVYFSQ